MFVIIIKLLVFIFVVVTFHLLPACKIYVVFVETELNEGTSSSTDLGCYNF